MEATMLRRLFPRDHLRYAESPFGDWLHHFADWLVATGYTPKPAHNHVRRLKQALERAGSEVVGSDGKFRAGTIAKIFTSSSQQISFDATRRTFERFLVSRDQLVSSKAGRFSPLLEAYRRHLLEMRGLAIATVNQHLATAKYFLAHTLQPKASLRDLSEQTIEAFVVTEGRRLKRQSLQHTVARLRAFLRFCYDSNELRVRLDAIDTPRTYRGEAPPRALAWTLVQGLLRSIDRSNALGLRDHAILWLMAHYGLRPSEIVTLSLTSIDWEAKTLRVEQCKTRSILILPLADKTLRMLKSYLHRGRPASSHPQLFLRSRAPEGPIKHTAISDLYQKHTRQSGLALDGSCSYDLRHSFAMRLLDKGVGIKLIGDLLGHRTLESTCVYLRLQTKALREVALPLPAQDDNCERRSA
jgi:integrase/recombinase XerD